MSEEATVPSPLKEHTLNPRPGVSHFTLPCGLIRDGAIHTDIIVNEMSGEDEELLVAHGEMTFRLDKIIANCVTSVGDIEVCKSTHIAQSFTTVDRYFLCVALRRASLGDDFTVDVQCPRCKKRQKQTADLSTLETVPMIDPMERSYSVTLPSGKVVDLHVATGADEGWRTKAGKVLGGESPLTVGLLMRIDAIDGEPCRHATTDKKRFQEDVKRVLGMSVRDRGALREAISKHEGDIDLTLEFTCTKTTCQHQWKLPLNVADRGFFSQ